MSITNDLDERLDAGLMQNENNSLFIGMNTVFFQLSKELETHILCVTHFPR
jgi:hypothetical protein